LKGEVGSAGGDLAERVELAVYLVLIEKD